MRVSPRFKKPPSPKPAKASRAWSPSSSEHTCFFCNYQTTPYDLKRDVPRPTPKGRPSPDRRPVTTPGPVMEHFIPNASAALPASRAEPDRHSPAQANPARTMVGPGRFERPTSPLSGVRSNRLSYGPEPLRASRPHRQPRRLHAGTRRRTWRDVRTAPQALGPKVQKSRGGAMNNASPIKGRLRPNPTPSPREQTQHRRSRKEVIQPQVPLRLPCYDFTPVADPTVDGCPLLRG